MTLDFHAQAIAKRDAEYEEYYQKLLVAFARNERRYSAYSNAYSSRMSKTYAAGLARTLQERSGYICTVRGGGYWRFRYVTCKFVPVPQ